MEKITIRFIALFIGVALMVLGMALFAVITFDFANFDLHEGIFREHILLWSTLIFGTGIALLLTQFFVERYSVRTSGVVLSGTLVVLYLFIYMVKTLIFSNEPEFRQEQIFKAVNNPHEVVLDFNCDQELVKQADTWFYPRTYVAVISGNTPNFEDQISNDRFAELARASTELKLKFPQINVESGFFIAGQIAEKKLTFIFPAVLVGALGAEPLFYNPDNPSENATGLLTHNQPRTEARFLFQLSLSKPPEEIPNGTRRLAVELNVDNIGGICG